MEGIIKNNFIKTIVVMCVLFNTCVEAKKNYFKCYVTIPNAYYIYDGKEEIKAYSRNNEAKEFKVSQFELLNGWNLGYVAWQEESPIKLNSDKSKCDGAYGCKYSSEVIKAIENNCKKYILFKINERSFNKSLKLNQLDSSQYRDLTFPSDAVKNIVVNGLWNSIKTQLESNKDYFKCVDPKKSQKAKPLNDPYLRGYTNIVVR